MARLKGLQQWLRYTEKVERGTRKDIEKLVKEVGDDIVRDAKAVVPVDTGRLKKSIKATPSSDKLGVRVGSDVEYAPYVEYGTYRMSARPYLTPAIAKHSGRLAKEMPKKASKNIRGGK